MTTRNVNEIGIRKGKISGYYTNSEFFFKKGGVKHYIDSVGMSHTSSGDHITHLHLRNSKTGKTDIKTIDELNTGRHRDSYFFTN